MLRQVVSGEVIEITEHGHPIARIVPLQPSALGQLAIEGRAREADGDLLDLLEEMALPAAPEGAMPPSEALADLRAGVG